LCSSRLIGSGPQKNNMFTHFAWIYTVTPPSKNGETWKLLNSLSDMREHMTNRVSLWMEWGVVGKQESFTQIPLLYEAGTLPELYENITDWINTLTCNPLMVFGSRNLFHPLVYNWGRHHYMPVSLPLSDLLELAILPGAIPTVNDRSCVDNNFARWLTGSPCESPSAFLLPLLTYSTRDNT